jgi:hypothetical protein
MEETPFQDQIRQIYSDLLSYDFYSTKLHFDENSGFTKLKNNPKLVTKNKNPKFSPLLFLHT